MAVKARRTLLTIRDTSNNLIAANKIFETGTLIIESDTDIQRRGDGVTAYNSLLDITGEKPFKAADRSKLDGIAAGATMNSTDASLRDRATHTGSMAATSITESSAKRFVTDTEKATWNAGETATTLGAKTNGSTAKTALIDADSIGVVDSAASNILKKITWANIKAGLKAHFDTFYPVLSGGKVPDANLPVTDLMTKVNLSQFENSGGLLQIKSSLLGSSAFDLAESLIGERFGTWTGKHGDNTISSTNANAVATTGTLTARTLSLSDHYGKTQKIGLVSTTTTADSVVAVRCSRVEYALALGFETEVSYFVTDAIATGKNFCGISTDTNPHSGAAEVGSKAHSCISIGSDTGDTNLSVISGISGALVKTSLGTDYPAQTTDQITVKLIAIKNDTSVTLIVTRRSRTTGAIVGTPAVLELTGAALPDQNTLMAFQLWRSSGSTAAAPIIDFVHKTIKTPKL